MEKFLLVINVIFILFFASCAPPVYLPNSINAPLLKGKGDAGVGYNKPLGGHDIQISHASSENVGLMLNGTYLSESWSDNYRRHKFIEMGMGFFHQDGGFIQEIYACGGWGSNSLKEIVLFDSEDARVSADYIRLFIQPNLGICKEGFEGGFGFRVCYINFYNINYSNIDFQRTKILLEPVVFIKLGPPVFKFQMQLGNSFRPFEDPEGRGDIFYDDRLLGAGFSIMLNIT